LNGWSKVYWNQMYSLNHFVLDLWMVCFVVRQLTKWIFCFQVVVEYETNPVSLLWKRRTVMSVKFWNAFKKCYLLSRKPYPRVYIYAWANCYDLSAAYHHQGHTKSYSCAHLLFSPVAFSLYFSGVATL
jgi:hypothetical protein